MSILRWFKQSNILENNLIQTAASAGEAVAGGIVYTVPALILIHYWTSFNYWQNVAIALAGGVLGVMFSIPLRHILVNDPNLKFPEGKAIAEVLIAGTQKSFHLRPMVMGAILGAGMEFAQTGIKIFTSTIQGWFSAGKTIWGFGVGFSATMLGVGYLVGFELGISLLIGAIVSWGILIPVLGWFSHPTLTTNATTAAISLWGSKIRYVGIGAMLTAGIWTLSTLLKPFIASLLDAALALKTSVNSERNNYLRTEMDIPLHYVCLGLLLCLLALYYIFSYSFPFPAMPINKILQTSLLWGGLIYVLVAGFIFSAICGYFSGMVGVTASPGSAIIIAALFLAALSLRIVLCITTGHHELGGNTQMHAAAIAILIGAVITSAACIANDNIQDLKVGQLVGATPWKQQVMLLFGVVIAAAIIPPIMQLLLNVYGIGDVLPRPGMNIADALPAPPAAMMAAVTQGVFNESMPWNMISLGVGIGIVLIILHRILRPRGIRFSILGIATGMYLPLTTSTPIFIGSMIQKIAARRNPKQDNQQGNLIACGLVTGAALMDVLLAIPFAIMENPEGLSIISPAHVDVPVVLGLVAFIGLLVWIYRQATLREKM
jgi:putative OPT family oligopeptide transporter